MESYQPTSELGWVDFSESDKNKVLKVIEMLKPAGTVDELGVGVVRDSMADAMFPGITTIMTRAKYYFIVPRILCSYIYDRNANRKHSMREYLRLEENEIMNRLASDYDYNEEQRIIGINKASHNRNLPKRRWEELVRKPSSIYWSGLRSFKIYTGQEQLSIFLNHFDISKIQQEKGLDKSDGETGDDRDAHINSILPFSLPDYDPKWKENLTLDLSNEEANFLKHKIIDSYPNTLLAYLIDNLAFSDEFINYEYYGDILNSDFMKRLPNEIVSVIYLASDFWKILFGAHIRYNLNLHKTNGINKDLYEQIEIVWKEWKEMMSKFNWKSFDMTKIWEITKSKRRVKIYTERFINSWIDAIQSKNFNEDVLDELVRKQEQKNKGSRSKLKPGNDEKYDTWIGLSNMEFRFGNAKLIVNDILNGLKDAGL